MKDIVYDIPTFNPVVRRHTLAVLFCYVTPHVLRGPHQLNAANHMQHDML